MNNHWKPQHILLGRNKINLDFIGKQENFDGDLKSVLDYITNKPNEQQKITTIIPHAVGANKELDNYLTPETAKLIEEIYEQDFFLYGYEKKVFDNHHPLINTQELNQSEYKDLVSIVIPCYNQAEYLEKTVESVIQQTYQNIEIIIVNDGSPDNTQEVATHLQTKYPDKIYILTQKNQGLSLARNNGIEMARGEYILPLDSDDRLEANMILHCMKTMQNKNADIVYVDLQCYGAANHIAFKKSFSQNDILYENLPPPMSLYKRIVWETNNGYKKNMNLGYEDWEFWVNAYKYGFKFQYHPETLVNYCVKENSMFTEAFQHDAYLKAKIVMNHPDLYPLDRQIDALNILKTTENLSDLYFYSDKPLHEESPFIQALNTYLKNSLLNEKQILKFNNTSIGLLSLDLYTSSINLQNFYENEAIDILIFYAPLRYEIPVLINAEFSWNNTNGLVKTHGNIFPYVTKSKREDTQLQQVSKLRLNSYRESILSQYQSEDLLQLTFTPLVSVVIPCYNQAMYLQELFKSIESQSYKHLEIIIVNDGSTDNTTETSNEIIFAYPQYDITLIEQDNIGLPETRNSGVDAAKGDYVVTVDADDKLHPHMIVTAIATIKKYSVDIVYGDYRRFGEETTIQKTGDSVNLYFIQYANVTGATALYKKTVWEKTGGYKPNMDGGYEDWEYWINAAKLGFKFHHIPQIFFYYRVKEESMYTESVKKHTYLHSKIIMNHSELYTQKEQIDAIKSIKTYENSADLYFYLEKHITTEKESLIKKLGLYINQSNLYETLSTEPYIIISSFDNLEKLILCNIRHINTHEQITMIKQKENMENIIFYSELRYDISSLNFTSIKPSDISWSKHKGYISTIGTIFPLSIQNDLQSKIEAYKRSEKYHSEKYEQILNSKTQQQNKYLNENAINIIRDGAVAIEKDNLKLAYQLMTIANKAKPEGPFIKNKLEAYKTKLNV